MPIHSARKNDRDLDHYVRYFEFSPMEALLTMTKYGGEAMDMPNELGQIREGFLADLTELLIPL